MPRMLDPPTTQVKPYVGLTDPRYADLCQSVGMNGANDLGRLVRALRKDRDMAQVELAAAIGVARSTIAGIERGHYMPGRETLVALADFFAVPVDHLRHGVTSPGTPRGREFINDPDELALISFWRALTNEQRAFMWRLLEVPKRNNSAA